jgi:integrase/recombinase XerD
VSSLAPALEAFFTDRLLRQRRVSPNTIASYRDTFRLLLSFAHQKTGTPPARLDVSDLDAPLIGAFLEHLETERGNSARTRNIRLAAIHSFFHYCALRHPEHAGLIQRVLAIPAKRFERRIVTFLTPAEVKALLASPDRATIACRRTPGPRPMRAPRGCAETLGSRVKREPQTCGSFVLAGKPRGL